ncbi:MAG: signal peptidase I [Pseudomonadota bacterium]
MKTWFRENLVFILFMVGLGVFRNSVADWNPVPTGSMRPTILEGDVVLVNRMAYDFKLPFSSVALAHMGDPKRGDIIVFSSPKDGVRLIKRVIGLPGDQVEMRDNILWVNGVKAEYAQQSTVMESLEQSAPVKAIRSVERLENTEHLVQWLPEVRARRDFPPVRIPEDSYLMLGDNRDNSGDSRYFGLVPRKHLIGKAHHLLVSVDIKDSFAPRFERFGEKI